MKGKKKLQIFYAVLNMGLGHATRSLVLIRTLQQLGARLWVGSSGRALEFLRQELSGVELVELPDYQLEYSRQGVKLFPLLLQTPRLYRLFQQEHKQLAALHRRIHFDYVFSDHRYGCYLPERPSFMIAHQLRFIAPAALRPFEFIGIWFNRYHFRHFRQVLVPDFPDGREGLLSGRLSRVQFPRGKIRYIGWLNSLPEVERPTGPPIDTLISLSGPEPQRTVLEEIVLQQVEDLPGRTAVLLGKPEERTHWRIGHNVEIYSHVSRQKMAELLQRSELVVSRSGYTTLMELASRGKKALLIPTPGQTEQEYLARRVQEQGWGYAVPQAQLNLEKDVATSQKFSGFPGKSLDEKLTSQYLKQLLQKY